MTAITKEQAKELVKAWICVWRRPDNEIIIVDESTIEKPWGWVFFYTSKKHKETKGMPYAIAGNAPMIVERSSGRLIPTGTAHPINYYIENYERTGNSSGLPTFKNVVKPLQKERTYRCPCCRYRTLRSRGGDEICEVCFWHDDGQDDHDAAEVRGGPNGKLSLTQARENFQAYHAVERRVLKYVREPTSDEL